MQLPEVEIKRILDNAEGKKILVIGDVMLDSYWWGKVDRISPEAPVPIVHVKKREFRLGGAANVALNLKRLGASPIMCAVAGGDLEAEIFNRLLEEEGISPAGMIYSQIRPTTVKTRVIGNNNQLLRIDSEDDHLITDVDSEPLKEKILILLADADLIIFEDYDKGVIGAALIEAIVNEANKRNIPIVVDPKKRNFLAYKNVTLFKPNLRELAEGLKIDVDGQSSIEEIKNAAHELMEKLGVKYSLITLSERGVYITDQKAGSLIPAHFRSISDVSGAGDTVVSVAALALLSGASMETIAALANLAGGLVCEKIGVVPIEKEELYREAVKEFAK